MKFLEYTPLERHLNLGECTIKGSLEAYSCKHAGSDKKLSLSLDNEILDYLGKSSETDSPSHDDYLLSRSSRKTLIYLVLTLSHMYPDYDFSLLGRRGNPLYNLLFSIASGVLSKVETWETFRQIFYNYMDGASKEWIEENDGTSLLDTIYKALDEVVDLSDCEIYSYDPDSDANPLLEEGAIWSFSFFFYNRKLKRVVSLCLCSISNFMGVGNLSGDEEDGEIFDDMDIQHRLSLDRQLLRCS